MRSQQRAREQAWAQLPLGRLTEAGPQLVTSCPRCGGSLVAHYDSPVGRCRNCGTDALLPVVEVHERARRAHGRVARLRRDIHALARGVARAR